MLTVLKIGGSLAVQPEKLKALCLKLGEISKKHELLLVPGGGEFADGVRAADKRFSLSMQVSHRMAILGMDQYGLLLSNLIPDSCIIYRLEQVEDALDSGKLPVCLPSNLMQTEDPLENSWEVTSDSITVYIAGRLHASKVLLVTDVDGIYTSDPKKNPDAELINKLSAEELLALNKWTSVDLFLPKLLLELQLECIVVNGQFPERIEAVLEGQAAVCTLITH